MVFLAMLSGTRAHAQGGATGAIGGAVVDSSGGAISGAEVQIISQSTDSLVRRLTTNGDGEFVAPLLPPGRYSAVVNKPGFGEAKVAAIEVRVTETTRVTITLRPGAVSETVQISAQVSSVETTSAATGESIGTSTIRPTPPAPHPWSAGAA